MAALSKQTQNPHAVLALVAALVAFLAAAVASMPLESRQLGERAMPLRPLQPIKTTPRPVATTRKPAPTTRGGLAVQVSPTPLAGPKPVGPPVGPIVVGGCGEYEPPVELEVVWYGALMAPDPKSKKVRRRRGRRFFASGPC